MSMVAMDRIEVLTEQVNELRYELETAYDAHDTEAVDRIAFLIDEAEMEIADLEASSFDNSFDDDYFDDYDTDF